MPVPVRTQSWENVGMARRRRRKVASGE